MPEKRQKFDAEFREGAVRLVNEMGKSIAAVARELGINEGTLGIWVVLDRQAKEGTRGLSITSAHDETSGWCAVMRPEVSGGLVVTRPPGRGSRS